MQVVARLVPCLQLVLFLQEAAAGTASLAEARAAGVLWHVGERGPCGFPLGIKDDGIGAPQGPAEGDCAAEGIDDEYGQVRAEVLHVGGQFQVRFPSDRPGQAGWRI